MSEYILLTGGTGFVGSHLLEKLLNLNKKVILLKRSFSNTWRINEFIENENLILKDIDKENLDNIFKEHNIRGVFHLASFIERNPKLEDIGKMIETNISFPTRLLENSIKNNVKFFINTGTCMEYNLNNSPLSETSEIKPFNLYAATKISFENILKYYCENFDLKCSTLKLFTPYGPKDNESKITPYLIINSIKNNEILIKSPSKKLDFVYINDVVEAYICLMNKITTFSSYESFNIGTSIGTTIKELFKMIETYCGNNVNVHYENIENDKVWCSNKKIKNELKWNPETKLNEGIKITIDYYTQLYGN